MSINFTFIKEVVVHKIKESGILPSYKVRERLAKKYLIGNGVEIGALHLPLPIPTGVTVQYVDLVSQEENIILHPELPAHRIVKNNYIDDGFTLNRIESSSMDFVIANHVLEHAPNPLQVLYNWGRILKPNGIFFISIPLAAKCFDKGRVISTLQHLIDDYNFCRENNITAFKAANREHYREWLTISQPKIRQLNGEKAKYTTLEMLDIEIDRLCSKTTEIHFHTFTTESFRSFLEHFTQSVENSKYKLLEVCCSRGNRECVAIIEKCL